MHRTIIDAEIDRVSNQARSVTEQDRVVMAEAELILEKKCVMGLHDAG